MTITNRELAVGTKLVAHYKGQTYEAEVIEGEGGKPAYWADGRTYSSPSAAGKAIRGGKETNGWAFWSLFLEDAAQAKLTEAKKVERDVEKAAAHHAKVAAREAARQAKAEEKAKGRVRRVKVDPADHIDCECPLKELEENGICRHENAGDCTPA